MESKTRKLATLAMLSAFAFIVMAVGRIPVILFLKYEPKDVIITIGGFLFGPLSAFAISAVVSLVEMVTVSDTGVIGCLMNVISTCAFACTASAIYKKKHSMKGAVLGLLCGIVIMTGIMLLWNYFITPFYMGYPREAVADLLLPAFLPFNLLKGFLNAALILLIYKPVVSALRKAKLVPPSESTSSKNRNLGILLVAIATVATCVLLVLVLQGIL